MSIRHRTDLAKYFVVPLLAIASEVGCASEVTSPPVMVTEAMNDSLFANGVESCSKMVINLTGRCRT